MDGNVKNDLTLLIAQYFQQVLPAQLESLLPDGPTLLRPEVQTAIYERMFDEGNRETWPLPSVNYRARVLKMILGRLEGAVQSDDDEILDNLMDTWGYLLTQPKPSAVEQAQKLGYIKYTAPSPLSTSTPAVLSTNDTPRTVITSESRSLILSSGTTGFRTWEAALHLGTYLASCPETVASYIQGKRVLELGAGTGFLSLFCAKYLRAEKVVATDREPALIERIWDCAGRNGLADAGRDEDGVLEAGIWEWGNELQTKSGGDGFDIALGADLIYDQDLIPRLLSTLATLFDNYKLQLFLLSATLRNPETFQAFLDACQANNFKVENMPFESPPEDKQTGFFHSTGIPIRTLVISRSSLSGPGMEMY